MNEFTANMFQSTKVWCKEIDDTKEIASINDLQAVASNILPKVVSRVTGKETMGRDKVMTIAWIAGMYLQAKNAEVMHQINENDWIADSYPDDIEYRYREDMESVTDEARDYLRADFEREFADYQGFSIDDSMQATDLFFRVVVYYEAVAAVYEEYVGALEAV